MTTDQSQLTKQPDVRLARALAAVAVLTPLPGLVGWILGVRALVQPLASFAPARLWGTPIIVLAALALLAKLQGHHRRAQLLAIASACGATIGILSGLLDIPLPLVEAAARRVALPVAQQQAFPYSIGVLFLLYNAALYLLTAERLSERRLLVISALASTQVAMGGVVFLAQLAGLLDSDAVMLVRAPLPGIISATLLGGALLQRATAREHRSLAPPRWAPMLAGVSVGLVVLVLWQALHAREEGQARSRDAVSVAALDRAMHRQLRNVNRSLARTAVYLAASTQREDPVWRTTLPRLIDETDGLQRLVWIDSVGRVLRTLPDDDIGEAGQNALRRFAAQVGPRGGDGTLADTSTTAHVAAMDSAAWQVALWYRVPSPVAGPTMLIGVISEQQLMRLFSEETQGELALRVTDGDRVLLSQGTLRGDSLVTPLQVGRRVLRVAVSQVSIRASSPLPDVMLVLGLAVAALLAMTLWLQRRIVEQASVEGMARMQRVIERATDGVWELDVPDGRTHRSPGLLRYLGLDPQLLEGGRAAWFARIHPDDAARVSATLDALVDGESEAFECEYRLQAGDGSWHTLVERGRVVERDGDGRPVRLLGISADVTERTRADAARDASERRFRAMFDTAYQMQLLLDLDGRILEANRAAGELANASAEGLQGVTFWLAPWWAEDVDTSQQVQERFVRARNGEALRFEVEVTLGRERPITVDVSLKPIRDGEDRVVQVLAEGRDLTIRKRAEESLREISTLTTMGQLAARVAHEINNPLAGIQNAFLLIRGAIPEDHQHYRFVGAIEREINRIAAVTRQLYETYRPDQQMARQASVILAVSDAVSFLEQVNRGRQVRILTDMSRAPSVVPVPDALLRQTLYNLVQNALDVSPPNGTIQVSAWQEEDECVLSVTDEGPGVPVAIRERIFDPFFSTKDRTMKTGGMGIGLALVRQSVLAVGGRIEVRDRPMGGTEFEVRLPMTPLDTGALR